MSPFRRIFTFAAALPLAVSVPVLRAQYAYSVTEIGSPQSYAFSGVYVDNAGDVAYTSSTSKVELYSDGTSTALGSGRAAGITSTGGTVLGSLYGTGTVYSGGTSSTLGLPANDELYAISGNGQYLVGSVNSGPNSVVTLFSSTGAILSQATVAPNVVELSDMSVNNSGVISGLYQTQSNASGTFIDANGTVTLVSAPAGGSNPGLLALNDSGVAVGEYSQGGEQSFVDNAGTLTTLTGLGGTATVASSINDSGQIVGFSTTAAGQSDAVIFQNNAATNLNSQVSLTGTGFASLDQADYVSNSGIIVGSGTLTTGQHAIFELTPGGGLSAVPEPTTYLLWTVLGLTGLAVWRQRHRRSAAAAS